jgi:alkylhydroperoxidase family enzyme
MARIEPLTLSAVSAELQPLFATAEEYMGFIANDGLTMAHVPELLLTAGPFMRSIYREGRISFELKRFIGMVSSWAAGCQYCTAHTAHGAAHMGVSDERIAALPDFARSPLFSDAERAALQVAFAAGQVPNAVTDAQFAELKRYYDTAQIVEIVAVIAMFGFLNRWNATLATELEPRPLQVAKRTLAARGWQLGPHGRSNK